MLRWLPRRLRWKTSRLLVPAHKRQLGLVEALGFELAVWLNEDVGRTLACHGVFEREDTEYIRSILRKDDICVDIGANVGYYSVMMATAAAQGRVIAIEPSPVTAALLKLNLSLNRIRNADIVEGVTADSSGTTQFQVAADSAFSSLRSSGRSADIESIAVKSYTLDQLVENFGLARVDILKVDVEGAEGLVIAGGRSLLADVNRRPRLVMLELYDANHRAFDTDSRAIQSQMEKFGYRAHYVDGSALKDWTDSHRNIKTNVMFVEPRSLEALVS